MTFPARQAPRRLSIQIHCALSFLRPARRLSHRTNLSNRPRFLYVPSTAQGCRDFPPPLTNLQVFRGLWVLPTNWIMPPSRLILRDLNFLCPPRNLSAARRLFALSRRFSLSFLSPIPLFVLLIPKISRADNPKLFANSPRLLSRILLRNFLADRFLLATHRKSPSENI